MSSPEDFAGRIADKRGGWSWVSVTTRTSQDARQAVGDALLAAGLLAPQADLSDATRVDAEELIRLLLTTDLAYGQAQMPRDAAADLAAEFIAFFSDDAEFMTNRTPDMSSWIPVTTHTMDALVVAIDPDNVGFICVADED